MFELCGVYRIQGFSKEHPVRGTAGRPEVRRHGDAKRRSRGGNKGQGSGFGTRVGDIGAAAGGIADIVDRGRDAAAAQRLSSAEAQKSIGYWRIERNDGTLSGFILQAVSQRRYETDAEGHAVRNGQVSDRKETA